MLYLYLSMVDTPEDKTKVEQIYYKYKRVMKKIAFDILENEQDAEDAVSDTFCLIIEQIDKIDNIDSPKTKAFIYENIKFICLNKLRRKKKIKFENIDNFIIKVTEAKAFEDINLKELFNQIINMPSKYRDILLFKTYFEYTNKEISELMKISESTVRKRLERAKNMLKEINEEEINV